MRARRPSINEMIVWRAKNVRGFIGRRLSPGEERLRPIQSHRNLGGAVGLAGLTTILNVTAPTSILPGCMRGSPSPRSRRSRPWMRSASSCKVTAATPRPWRSSSSCRSPIPRVWSCAFADVFFLLMLLLAALAALRSSSRSRPAAWCLTGKAPSRYPKLVIFGTHLP